MHTSLKPKTTLVTGVTSGIGREIAQLLAERGARVFGTVRNPQSASPIPGVEIVRMEVTDDASVNETVHSILQKAGPIQYLVNNAGYSFMGALEETSVHPLIAQGCFCSLSDPVQMIAYSGRIDGFSYR